MVALPSELRTYTTVKSHYCKGGNIPGSDLPEAAADLCVTKCAADPTLPGCSDMDSAPDGCKSQYEQANLGPSTSYKFLAKMGTST